MTHHAVHLALSGHMAQRRESVIAAWCTAVAADPCLTTSRVLSPLQLRDHIPNLLEGFERRLRSGGPAADGEPSGTGSEPTRAGVGGAARSSSEAAAGGAVDPDVGGSTAGESTGTATDAQQGGAAHGLHRWQQGFDLAEVTRELAWLNGCVVRELDDFARVSAPLQWDAMGEARRIWAVMHGAALGASMSQFFKLQQMESASHAAELEEALSMLQEHQTRHAELWQQAAHDLRGNLGVVANATAGLSATQASPQSRDAFMRLLQRNVRSLQRLLEDVTSLARLQGGREVPAIAPIEAAGVLREVCESLEPLAQERQLYLRFSGPPVLRVDGDEIKLRRIVQNLVLNAIKYTHDGGAVVRWGDCVGEGPGRWFVEVSDTGPGFTDGAGAAVAAALEAATRMSSSGARVAPRALGETREDVARRHGTFAAGTRADGGQRHDQVRDTAGASAASGRARGLAPDAVGAIRTDTAEGRPPRQSDMLPGEGIGLSIVKRLCELLDATLELESDATRGSTLRVIFPARYTKP